MLLAKGTSNAPQNTEALFARVKLLSAIFLKKLSKMMKFRIQKQIERRTQWLHFVWKDHLLQNHKRCIAKEYSWVRLLSLLLSELETMIFPIPRSDNGTRSKITIKIKRINLYYVKLSIYLCIATGRLDNLSCFFRPALFSNTRRGGASKMHGTKYHVEPRFWKSPPPPPRPFKIPNVLGFNDAPIFLSSTRVQSAHIRVT